MEETELEERGQQPNYSNLKKGKRKVVPQMREHVHLHDIHTLAVQWVS